MLKPNPVRTRMRTGKVSSIWVRLDSKTISGVVLVVTRLSSNNQTLGSIALIKVNAIRTGSIIRLKISSNSNSEMLTNRIAETIRAIAQGPTHLSSSTATRNARGKTINRTPTSSRNTPTRR